MVTQHEISLLKPSKYLNLTFTEFLQPNINQTVMTTSNLDIQNLASISLM